MHNSKIAAAALCVIALAAPAAAQTSDYPAQPIRIVVSTAPGGVADTIARIIGRKFEALGKPVIIDNRPGSAAIIGNTHAAKAMPDGYTLLLGFAGGLAINMSLYPNLPYDSRKDFEPIGLIAKSPLVVVASKSLSVKSLKELIAHAKANPGVLNFASTGTGSTQHLCVELIKSRTGIGITHVPYKGSAPALVDLLAGRAPVMCENVASMVGNITEGSLTPLAVTSLQRVDVLKDVPTLSEAGIENMEAVGWYGLLAPAKTPPEIIRLLNAALRKAVAEPDVAKALKDQGLIPEVGSAEEFRAFIDTEIVKWGQVVKDSGAKVQ